MSRVKLKNGKDIPEEQIERFGKFNVEMSESDYLLFTEMMIGIDMAKETDKSVIAEISFEEGKPIIKIITYDDMEEE